MIDLGFIEIDGVVFVAMIFGAVCAILQIVLTFTARRFIGRLVLPILLTLGAGALMLCAVLSDGWTAVGYLLLAAYCAVIDAACVAICTVCSAIRYLMR